MAASGYTPISIYHSTTASAAPTAGNLVNGELAINILDGKLYYKDSGGTVQVIATKGTGTIGGSTTQVQYNNAGALAGSANFTFNGTTATINTLNLTNALGAAYGGTAQSTYAQGDLLYASAANTLAKLPIGINTYILTSNGTIPGWAIPSSVVIGTATNLAGGAAGSVPYQSGASTTTFLSIGTANQVITSTGTAPQWSSSLTLTGLSNSGLTTLDKTVTVGNTSFNGAAVFAPSTPAKVYLGTGTVTDVTSAIAATNAAGAIVALGVTPIAATNANVTYTNASTLYIAGAPSAGTNITITNPYALYVAAGDAYFGGTVTAGTVNLTTLDLTNLEVTNIKAKDGTASMTLADSTGVVTFSANPVLNAGTANGVPYLNASKVLTTGSALTFDGTKLVNTSGVAGALIQSTDTGGSGSFLRMLGDASSNNLINWTTGTALRFATSADNFGSFAELMRLTSTGLKSSIAGTNADPVFSYTSDTNTGIFFPAADKLGFVAGGGSDQMVLTTTGLGIGTSSPQARLEIAQSADNTDGPKLRIANNGNTLSNGQLIGGIDFFDGDDSGEGVGAYIYSYTTDSIGRAEGQDLRFATGGTTERMRLDASGNLGIGVAPVYRLDVVQDQNAATYARVRNNDSGSSSYAGFIVNAFGNSWGMRMGSSAANSNALQFVQDVQGTPNVRATLDTSGNLGLGVTPSAWDAAGAGGPILQIGRGLLFGANTETRYLFNTYYGTGDFRYIASSIAAINYQQASGQHRWFVDANAASPGAAGTIVTFTQAMTLDASGNLGIGVTNPTAKLHIYEPTAAASRIRVLANGGQQAALQLAGNGTTFGTTSLDVFQDGGSDAYVANRANASLQFWTNNTERARITSGGYFKASNSGTYNNSTGSFHELYQNSASEPAVVITTPDASYTGNSTFIEVARNTTNNSFYALSYYNTGAAAFKFRVADSGNVTNTNGTYGTISDAKMKTDIVDAGSQWSDIKALRFRKFKMKDDPSGLVQLGVVAQEVEQTSPGLVDEHADKDAEGNDLGTTTKSVKTSVLLMKAAVALQEAMTRIEKLEAEVAALKGA